MYGVVILYLHETQFHHRHTPSKDVHSRIKSVYPVQTYCIFIKINTAHQYLGVKTNKTKQNKNKTLVHCFLIYKSLLFSTIIFEYILPQSVSLTPCRGNFE